MALDPTTRQQLIEARERIKAQLIDDEGVVNDPLSYGGPADFGGVYGELQQQLREIDELLGQNPDEDEEVSTRPPPSYFPVWASNIPGRGPKFSIFFTAVGVWGLLWYAFLLVHSCVQRP